jgi:hypothetical protein
MIAVRMGKSLAQSQLTTQHNSAPLQSAEKHLVET